MKIRDKFNNSIYNSKNYNIILFISVLMITLIILLLTITPLISGINGSYCDRIYDESGTNSDPLKVSNVSELKCIENHMNKNIVLTKDIEFNESQSKNLPIGYDYEIENSSLYDKKILYANKENVTFSGSFDGQNHTIEGINIQRERTVRYPDHFTKPFTNIMSSLFIHNNGTIKNLNVKNMNLKLKQSRGIGGVVAYNQGYINNVEVSGQISSTGSLIAVGGIVGKSESKNWHNETNSLINNSKSKVDIKTPENIKLDKKLSFVGVGGIVGTATKTDIVNSKYNGEIEYRFNDNKSMDTEEDVELSETGGIVGSLYRGSVIKSSSDGIVNTTTLNVEENRHTGGIVGYCNTCGIYKSYSSSNVIGREKVGGILGGSLDDGVVNDTYFTGSVKGKGTHITGDGVGNGQYVGGIVGEPDVDVNRAYMVGNTTGGPISGSTGDESTNAYHSIKKTGSYDREDYVDLGGYGTGIEIYDSIPLSDSNMRGEKAKKYLNGFDFNNTWKTVDNSYPKLNWEN